MVERCPNCSARFPGASDCARCGADLRQVLDIERAALHHQRRCLGLLASGRTKEASQEALRACYLHRTRESLKALALCSLTLGRHSQAFALWREYERDAR